MSRRLWCTATLIALGVSACGSAEQRSPQPTGTADAPTSSAISTSETSQTSVAASPSGPTAEILKAPQVRPDDYHEMSFGGDSPESMTHESSQVAFMTPSSNIACNWSLSDPTGELGLNCRATERTSPPPQRPADCQYAWATGYVQLRPDGSVEDGVCTGGALTPSIANTLSYGSALVAGEFGCLSAEAGVTCAHIPSGRGFQLSREKLTTF